MNDISPFRKATHDRAPGDNCALIIDRQLPVGLKANTAALLSLSLGSLVRGLVGEDLRDAFGNWHRGIDIPHSSIYASYQQVEAL